MDAPRMELATVVLDCPDSDVLADFYSRLLGWEVTFREPGWALMRSPHGGTGLSFQSEPWYRSPTWPEVDGEPTKMLHLDLYVSDLEEAVAHAISVGARLSDFQPQ
jgi:catechol 2,3-dioxygenase-like lactoylglutathione lyase family enzyme